MSRRERINKIAFHLGKGIWKGIPVVGPIVEEVFYEANKDLLLKEIEERTKGLSDEELEKLELAATKVEDAIKNALLDLHKELQEDLAGLEKRLRKSDIIQTKYDRLQEILDGLLLMELPTPIDDMMIEWKLHPERMQESVLQYRAQLQAHYQRFANILYVSEHLLDKDLLEEIREVQEKCQTHDKAILLHFEHGENSEIDATMFLIFQDIENKGFAAATIVEAFRKQITRLSE